MDDFNNFFDKDYDQHNNTSNYHTPDNSPQKQPDKKKALIIALSVTVAIMCLVVIINVIVLASLKTEIAGIYAEKMKAEINSGYYEAIDKKLNDSDLVNDIKDDAVNKVTQILQSYVSEKVKADNWNSVAEIVVTDTRFNTSTKTFKGIGSGFIIEATVGGVKDVYLITNAHVIRGELASKVVVGNFIKTTYSWQTYQNITCTFNNDDTTYNLQVLNYGGYTGDQLQAENSDPDLAICKFVGTKPNQTDAKGNRIHPFVKLAPASTDTNKNATEGEPIAIIGSPQGIGLSISAGIISKTNIVFGAENALSTGTFIMTDAAINGGNSGGPMFNKNSQLIGVVESKIVKDGVESMGFALSVDTLREFLTNHNYIVS